MDGDRPRLEDLFRRVALEGDLGRDDAAQHVIGQIIEWVGATLQIPSVTQESSLDDLLDAYVSPEGHAYLDSMGEPGGAVFTPAVELAMVLIIDLDLLAQARKSGRTDQALRCLIRLIARLSRETSERAWEPDRQLAEIKRRWNSVGGLAASAERRAQGASQRARWQSEYERLRRENPAISKNRAAELIAELEGNQRSPRTIRRALRD